MADVETLTLEEWRKRKGFDARELLAIAAKGRVSASTIGRIERGEVCPERNTREFLAAALGVSVEQIKWPKPE